jgi:predicted transcriptional regulator
MTLTLTVTEEAGRELDRTAEVLGWSRSRMAKELLEQVLVHDEEEAEGEAQSEERT